MYRILIVDDEYLSRFVLKTIVSKKICNVQIVGEAENGRQAIEANRELRPDLIIMDIKMPGINGIEASREILKEFPEVCVLILTAYDNFDYIKDALDIGVKGYILKPVKEEEVVEKVNKLMKEMDDRANRLGFDEQVENKIKVVKPLIESELISSFISGKFDVEKIESYASFLQVQIKSGYFMLISPGHMASKSIDDSIRNRIIKDKIYDTAEKHLPLMKRCYFGNSNGNTVIAFFPTEIENNFHEISKEALLIGEEIKNRIKVIAHMDVAIGIGNVHPGIQNLSKSYSEANVALQKALKEKRIVHFGLTENDGTLDCQAKYPFDLEDKLIDQIKIGNAEKTDDLVEEIISYIFANNFKVEKIKESVAELITVLKRTALKTGVNLGMDVRYDTILELSELSDIEEINEWCRRNACTIISLIKNRSNRNKDVISKAFENIDKNFTKDITLESVANDVGISPQYLSKIFKEGYGSNFIDYITSKRMEYAKELLQQRDISVKEISLAIGYGDPNYFCKIFKKDTGLTPKQFRGQKTSED